MLRVRHSEEMLIRCIIISFLVWTRSVARLTRLPVTEEIAGSNPVASAHDKNAEINLGVFVVRDWIQSNRVRLTLR